MPPSGQPQSVVSPQSPFNTNSQNIYTTKPNNILQTLPTNHISSISPIQSGQLQSHVSSNQPLEEQSRDAGAVNILETWNNAKHKEDHTKRQTDLLQLGGGGQLNETGESSVGQGTFKKNTFKLLASMRLFSPGNVTHKRRSNQRSPSLRSSGAGFNGQQLPPSQDATALVGTNPLLLPGTGDSSSESSSYPPSPTMSKSNQKGGLMGRLNLNLIRRKTRSNQAETPLSAASSQQQSTHSSAVVNKLIKTPWGSPAQSPTDRLQAQTKKALMGHDGVEKAATPKNDMPKVSPSAFSGGMLQAIKTQGIATQWRQKASLRILPQLAPFIPQLLQEKIYELAPSLTSRAQGEVGSKWMQDAQPTMDTFVGAVMVADITGFTKLTEKLSTRGSAGVELLTACMNDFFGQVIELIYSYNGDVMKFAGDSVIVAFYPSPEEATTRDKGLKAATHRAVHCAVDLADNLGHMRMLNTGAVVKVSKEQYNLLQGESATVAANSVQSKVSFASPEAQPKSTATEEQGQRERMVRFREARKSVKIRDPDGGDGIEADKNWWQKGGQMLGAAMAFRKPGEESVYDSESQAMGSESSVGQKNGVSGSEMSDQGKMKRTLSRRSPASTPTKSPGRLFKNLMSMNQRKKVDVEDNTPPGQKEGDNSPKVMLDVIQKSMHVDRPPDLQKVQYTSSNSSSSILSATVSTTTMSARSALTATQSVSQLPAASRLSLGSAINNPTFDRRSMGKVHMAGNSPDEEPVNTLSTAAEPSQNLASAAAMLRQLPGEASGDGEALWDLMSSQHSGVDLSGHVGAQRYDSGGLQGSGQLHGSQHLLKEMGGDGGQLEGKSRGLAGRDSSKGGAVRFQGVGEGVAVGRVDKGKERMGGGVYDSNSSGLMWEGVGGMGGELHGAQASSFVSESVGSYCSAQTSGSAYARADVHKKAHTSRSSRQFESYPRTQKQQNLGEMLNLVSMLEGGGSPGRALAESSESGPSLAAIKLSQKNVVASIGLSAVAGLRAKQRLEANRQQSDQGGQNLLKQASMAVGGKRSLGTVFGAAQLALKSKQIKQQLTAANQQDSSVANAESNFEEKDRLLSLKMIVGAGIVCVFRLGGFQGGQEGQVEGNTGRWEFFIGDMPHGPETDTEGRRQPIMQIAQIEEHANAGEVIVSSEVLALLGRYCYYQELPPDAARVWEMKTGFPKDSAEGNHRSIRERFSVFDKFVQSRVIVIFRQHIVENIRARLEAGHKDYINEIRHLTVLFIGFPSLTEERDIPHGTEVSTVQSAVESVQRRMTQFEGSFLQFRCDEKGFLSICAFGLPGRTHEDNPKRAISAAVKLVQDMHHKGERAVVGVTTGDLLCAIVGSVLRAEYTVFGDPINLSARLMVKAKKGMGQILCDQNTYERTKLSSNFTELEAMMVKGKAQPVRVFRVEVDKFGQAMQPWSTMGKSTRVSTLQVALPSKIGFVGREDIIAQVKEMLVGLEKGAPGRVLIIKGDAGMGKSALIDYVAQLTREHRIECLKGQADAAYKQISLYLWRSIYKRLFNHDRIMSQNAYNNQRYPTPDKAQPVDKGEYKFSLIGTRMSVRVHDYEQWRQTLADVLSCSVDVLPPAQQALPSDRDEIFNALKTSARTLSQNTSLSGSPKTPGTFKSKGSHGNLVFMNSVKRSRSYTGGELDSKAKRSQRSQDVPTVRRGSYLTGVGRVSSDDSQLNGLGQTQAILAMGSQAPLQGRKKLPPLIPATPTTLSQASSPSKTQPSTPQQHTHFDKQKSNPLIPPAVASQPNETKKRNSAIALSPSTPIVVQQPKHSTTELTSPSEYRNKRTHRRSMLSHKLAVQNQPTNHTDQHGVARSQTSEHLSIHLPGWLTSRELQRQKTLELLLQLLKEFVAIHGPAMVLLDNMQHADSMSWQLLQLLSEELEISGIPIVVIVAFRPQDGMFAIDLQHQKGTSVVRQKIEQSLGLISSLGLTRSFTLQPFSKADVHNMLVQCLQQEDVGTLVDIIYQNSEGMPVYLAEVVQFIANIQQDASISSEDVKEQLASRLKFQTSVNTVIIERIDKLRPSHQLTIKVASVLGLKVDSGMIAKIYPVEQKNIRAAIQNDLEELVEQGFLKSLEDEGMYQFSTGLTRDIVYGVIPTYQRRSLHAAVAKQLELQPDAHIQHIAYHWTQSCTGVEISEFDKAARAVELWIVAARQAAEESQNADALRLYQKALGISETLMSYYVQQKQAKSQQFKQLLKDQAEAQEAEEGLSLDPNYPEISALDRGMWLCQVADLSLALLTELAEGPEYDLYVDVAQKSAMRALELFGAPQFDRVFLSSVMDRESLSTRCWTCGLCTSSSAKSGRRMATLLQLGYAPDFLVEQHDELDVEALHGTFAMPGQLQIEGALDAIELAVDAVLLGKGAVDLELLKFLSQLCEYFSQLGSDTEEQFVLLDERIKEEVKFAMGSKSGTGDAKVLSQSRSGRTFSGNRRPVERLASSQ